MGMGQHRASSAAWHKREGQSSLGFPQQPFIQPTDVSKLSGTHCIL